MYRRKDNSWKGRLTFFVIGATFMGLTMLVDYACNNCGKVRYDKEKHELIKKNEPGPGKARYFKGTDDQSARQREMKDISSLVEAENPLNMYLRKDYNY